MLRIKLVDEGTIRKNKLDWIEWNNLSRNPAIFNEALY